MKGLNYPATFATRARGSCRLAPAKAVGACGNFLTRIGDRLARNNMISLYFYGANLQLSQVLEFDINQYFDGLAFTWGQQCRIAGGHEWDIWDNLNWKWIPTGVPCNPVSNQWNHVTIQAQRTSSNRAEGWRRASP